jgi:hypothetical protein
MNRPELAKRFAHLHPNQDDIPFLERGDFLSAERIHAGTGAFFFLSSEVRARDQRVIEAPGLLELLLSESHARRSARGRPRQIALSRSFALVLERRTKRFDVRENGVSDEFLLFGV